MHPALSPLFNTAPLVATFYFVVATGVQSGADVQVWIVGAHVMAWQARRRTSTALRSGSGATFEHRNMSDPAPMHSEWHGRGRLEHLVHHVMSRAAWALPAWR